MWDEILGELVSGISYWLSVTVFALLNLCVLLFRLELVGRLGMVASRRERRGWNCGYDGRSYDEARSSKRMGCT